MPHLTLTQVQNNVTEIGEVGCTFWQYNPSETYAMMGKLVENKKLLEPGRVRFENQGMSADEINAYLPGVRVRVRAC